MGILFDGMMDHVEEVQYHKPLPHFKNGLDALGFTS